MKRLTSVLLIISLLIACFTGCKEKEEPKKEDKCSYCDAQIIEGTLYCVRCGESLEKETEK